MLIALKHWSVRRCLEHRFLSQLAIATMPFLDTLAGARTEALTKLFNLLTWFGDEKLFVVISLIVVWCFSKQGGWYMLTVGFGASSIGQMLKMVCRIPRPWNLGEKPFEHADPIARGSEASGTGGKLNKLLGGGADGWAFPSGHTLISVGTYGGMAAWFRQKWTISWWQAAASIRTMWRNPVCERYLSV